LSDDFKFQNTFREGIPNPEISNSTDRLTDLVEQTRSSLLRTQRRIERNERQYESLMHHIQALWVFIGLVVIGGAGLLWYGFSTLSRQAQGVPGQVQLDSTPSQRLNTASPSTNSEQTRPALSPDLSSSSSSVPVAPAPATSQPIAPTYPEVNASPPPAQKRAERADISKIDRLSDGIKRQRVDFAVMNNKTEQISPGLYLTIYDTDVRKQVVDGSIQISSEGHTVRILGQEAEKVLIFGKKKDPRPIALVFTHVESNRVSGYLMVPPSDSGD